MKKIRERKGASIIFALAIFLIATIVSFTIVSIAVTNVQRIKRQKDAQQANLAVTSAAKYVQKLFDGCGCYRDVEANKWVVAYGDSELGKLVKKNEAFETSFKNLVGGIQGTKTPMIWSITASDTSIKTENALDVKLEASLDDKNNIVVRISKLPEEEYEMTLVFIANVFVDENGNDEYTWEYSTLDRANIGDSNG